MSRLGTDRRKVNPAKPESVLRSLAFPLVITYAFLPLSFQVPLMHATNAASLEHGSSFLLLVYGITQTGGPVGASAIGIVMLVLIVNRPHLPGRQRFVEGGVLFVVLASFAGGGAALNEYVVKPAFNCPRPNVVYLAGKDGSGPLRMPVNEFYAMAHERRSEYLRTVLAADPPPVALPRLIREHWIESTGYSFPSGHAFTAMLFAAFFLAMSLTFHTRPRLRCFAYLLLPWAVCVCYSRVVLRVHTSLDISAGGLAGMLLGALAFAVARAGIAAAAGRTMAPKMEA
ncbi:MAG: phosphatase PAP2 family protein [bacterium]